jgi:hypothetical protein
MKTRSVAEHSASNNNVPWIPTKRGVMDGIEAVVVGNHDVGVVIQQQGEHVISFL